MDFSKVLNQEYIDVVLPKLTGYAISLPNFLNLEYAESCYKDLTENILYEDHIYGDLTHIKTAKKNIGEVYKKGFKRKDVTSSHINKSNLIYDLFESDYFIEFVSEIVEEPLYSLRPVSPYKFQDGDYLCLHDDMSHPNHAYEVVLNLTKDWKKEFGGYSIGGYIKNRSIAPTPEFYPFFLEELILDESKENYSILPEFNKLTILKLSDKLCHGTTKVTTTDNIRIVLACIYGSDKINKTTTKWR